MGSEKEAIFYSLDLFGEWRLSCHIKILVFFCLLETFFRHDLLDISPTLSEAAGAIVDV